MSVNIEQAGEVIASAGSLAEAYNSLVDLDASTDVLLAVAAANTLISATAADDYSKYNFGTVGAVLTVYAAAKEFGDGKTTFE